MTAPLTRSRHAKAIAPDKTDADRIAFASKLNLIRSEACALGLPITAQALHDAVRAIGWEIAGQTEEAARFVSKIP